MMDGDSAGRDRSDLEELQEEVARLKAELQEQRTRARKPFPWRNFLAWVLIVLATLTAVAAPIASWGHDYLLDTDRFVNTVAPLIQEDDVAQAISIRAAEKLVEELNIEGRLDRLLPDNIDFLSAPLASGIETLAQKSAKAILESDQFYWVWERILTIAHTTAVEAIRSERAIEITEEGDVLLDIGALLQEVKDQLVDAGLSFLDRVPVPADAGTLVLFTSRELGMAKGGVHALDTLNWFLTALALLFFIAAVAISTERRKFLMASGIGFALAMAITLIALNVSENQLLGHVESELNLAAAQVVWTKLFSSLVAILWGGLALLVAARLDPTDGGRQLSDTLRLRREHLGGLLVAAARPARRGLRPRASGQLEGRQRGQVERSLGKPARSGRLSVSGQHQQIASAGAGDVPEARALAARFRVLGGA